MGASHSEEDLFAAALALPAAERDRYLDRACAGDHSLLKRLQTLLGAFDDAAGFVKERSTVGHAESIDDEIGSYRLLHELGEGGYGVVYLAEQTAPIRRHVALKVIKLGMDTKAVIARFEAERQALALMDHPNIARVFDAGATRSGRPFFAMERVRGIKITDYCGQARLSISERLTLFMQVCQAVQHAHYRGIIHRDLKPSNILVTLSDGVPMAKIIDFGIALSAAFVALLIGATVTTLIQSHRIGLERDVAQSERERAEAVSAFLIDSFRLADPSRARGNQITAKEILDAGATRVGTELRKQPALQATLLDTIGAVYLSLGRPAEAQPHIEQALSIRRKLFGPDSLEVAQSLGSLNRAYEQKGDLEAAEALARRSLQITAKLTGRESIETAANLCQLGFIELQKGELAEAEQLFQECLRTRTARLGRSHELIAPPLDNLARLAQVRHDYVTAERLYRQALDIDLRKRGEDHPQYIRHLHNLATVLHERGDLDAAESIYRRAIELSERVFGPEHGDTILVTGSMASLLLEQGKLAQARAMFETTLALNRKIRGERHTYVGYHLVKLARVDLKSGQLAAAEQRLNEALDIYRAHLPPGHGFIATALTWLGRAYLEQGRPLEAERVLQQALESWRQQYGEQSVEFAIARAFLGRAWAMQERYQDAEFPLTDSYPIVLSSPRSADREVAATIRQWIENFYTSTGRPHAAREYFAKLESEP